MAEHNEYGKRGEKIAVGWLSENGFEILDRNWRCGRLELDVVCRMGEMIVVVEVKSRRKGAERVCELLSADKRRRLMQAGAAWLAKHNACNELRFDLLVVDCDSMKIDHYPEAVSICD